jgi:hypothetical protein
MKNKDVYKSVHFVGKSKYSRAMSDCAHCALGRGGGSV